MYTDLKGNSGFRFGVFIVFSLLFSSCQVNNYRSNNIQRLFSPTNISIPEQLTVPLIVRKYYDETAVKDCSFIPDIFFTKASHSFNTGFYKGVLWLDVYFPDTIPKLGTKYMLDLGNEPCDFAEVFVEKEHGNWSFAGRTGRSILRNQMSYPSWQMCVPINEDTLDESKVHHLRIKLMSFMATRIDLKLIPQRNYQYAFTMDTMRYALTGGLIIVAILFLLLYGCIFKDKIYIMLSIAAVFLLLARTQYKGVGPIYYWNFIAQFPFSNRLVIIFFELSVSFLLLNFLFVIKEQNSKIKAKPIVIPIFTIIMVSILSTFIIRSPFIAYCIFAYGFIAICILTSILIIINKIDFDKDLHVFLISWFISIATLGVRQIAHFITIHFDSSTFTFFEGNFNYSFDIIFLFSLTPAIYISAKRLRRRFAMLKAQVNVSETKSKELKSQQKVIFSVIHELFNELNVIQNTIRLPSKSEKNIDRETYSLLLRTSTRSLDLLNALCVFSENKVPDERMILLLPFLYSCLRTVEDFAKTRGNTLAVTVTFASDRVIYANPNIIELIFSDFFSTVVKYSPRNSRLAITITDDDGLITCSIRNNSHYNESKNARLVYDIDYSDDQADSSGSSWGLGFHLIKRAAEYYNGTVLLNSDAKGTTFIVTMKFKVLNQETSNLPPVVDSSRIIFTEDKSLQKKKLITISDSMFSVNGRIPTILLIEDVFEIRDLITMQLEKHSTVLNTVNGLEAWNFLNSYNSKSMLPDLIISEYDLPIMNGAELFRKCKLEPMLQDIPFIFIAPLGEFSKRAELVERGAADCLLKPFSITELLTRVYSVLTIKEMAHHEMISKISTMVQVRQVNVPTTPSESESETTANSSTHTVSLTSTQQALFNTSALSSREQQIALLISEGKSDKQIADELFISPATVATHNKKLFKKLGVHSRVELMNKVR
jgi:DNA-binding NarL/FixJ family response regulator/signal transduction histidine kinase